MIQSSLTLLAPPYTKERCWYEEKRKNPRASTCCTLRGICVCLEFKQIDMITDMLNLRWTLPVCCYCSELNYFQGEIKRHDEVYFHHEWLASTNWCLFKGHLSPAAVPAGWACVLTIRRRLDLAAMCRWWYGVCQRPQWPFPQVHVVALSSTRLISGCSQPRPQAHCSFISHPSSVCPAGCCCELP